MNGKTLIVASHPIDGVADLTDAERSVVEGALAGESNMQIARQRGTSARTVANLLARAYTKLGVRSRLELAARRGRMGGRVG